MGERKPNAASFSCIFRSLLRNLCFLSFLPPVRNALTFASRLTGDDSQSVPSKCRREKGRGGGVCG